MINIIIIISDDFTLNPNKFVRLIVEAHIYELNDVLHVEKKTYSN